MELKKLQQVRVLQGGSPRALQELAGVALERNYGAKMLIFLEGEPGDWVYLLLEGRIKLYKSNENGQEKTLFIAGPGEILGETVLFSPNNYTVTAETLAKSRLVLFPRDTMIRVAAADAWISWRLAELLNLRLRRAYRQVRNQALLDTYLRLVSRLYKLTRDHGLTTDRGIRVDLSLTHQELANFIGASRETVSRLMKDLERDGLIIVEDHHLLIPDRERLRNEFSSV